MIISIQLRSKLLLLYSYKLNLNIFLKSIDSYNKNTILIRITKMLYTKKEIKNDKRS